MQAIGRAFVPLFAAACGACLCAGETVVALDPARLPRVTAPEAVARGQAPLEVAVLALEFDPLIPGDLLGPRDAGAAPAPLREVGGWNDPVELARGYMQAVCDASGGFIQYRIAEWLVVREFQKKVDGFTYTPETYMRALRAWRDGEDPWHKPDMVDYPGSIERYDIVSRIEAREIDEVWWLGAPFFGYYESSMAGKDAFYINGGVYGDVPSKRRFAIMGFNYERGVAEMLHDLSHRTESTMARIYGGWNVEKLDSTWARFAANEHQSGVAAVGTCHYPPNGEKDYDYANVRFVVSSAPDWFEYPKLTGKVERVNRETWGGPDYHLNYMKWWFAHLPKAPGANEDDGRANNWWKYVFDFNRYDEKGSPLPGAAAAGTEGPRRPR